MKIKTATALLLTALMLVTFAACGSSSDGVPDGMKVLEQASGSYTIYVPETWIVDVSTGFASAYVSNTDSSNVSFMAYAIPSDETTPNGNPVRDVETFWSAYEADIISTFGGIDYETFGTETSAEGEKTDKNYVELELDGLKSRKYVYYATIGGDEYMYMQVVGVDGASAYLLTYTAKPNSFDSHLDDVERIIEEFKFS